MTFYPTLEINQATSLETPPQCAFFFFINVSLSLSLSLSLQAETIFTTGPVTEADIRHNKGNGHLTEPPPEGDT